MTDSNVFQMGLQLIAPVSGFAVCVCVGGGLQTYVLLLTTQTMHIYCPIVEGSGDQASDVRGWLATRWAPLPACGKSRNHGLCDQRYFHRVTLGRGGCAVSGQTAVTWLDPSVCWKVWLLLLLLLLLFLLLLFFPHAHHHPHPPAVSITAGLWISNTCIFNIYVHIFRKACIMTGS